MVQFMQDTPSFRLLLDEFENTLTDIKCWLEDASRTEAKMLHTTMVQLLSHSLHVYS